ncbi:hypothetical protein [Nocardia transvalensis]|uniref:hypothetical protein n=1 Tax=Nocardia transvalensis TaxID=37333 RepID=UPI001E59128E|nr:hypothetical protein [Nocardia transvalensis]
MSLVVAAGGADGCGAVAGGESSGAGKSEDISDIAEQPRRTGRADAVQAGQSCVGRGEQRGQFPIGSFDLLVQRSEFAALGTYGYLAESRAQRCGDECDKVVQGWVSLVESYAKNPPTVTTTAWTTR